MKKFFVFVVPLFFCVSCATYHYGSRPKYDLDLIDRTTFDDLVVEPTHDLYDYRFDVIRQMDGFPQPLSGWTSSECDPLPHYPLGVRLGNGLFFDLNRNLTLDLFSVMSLPKVEQLALKKTVSWNAERPHRIRIDSTEYCERTPNGRRWICQEFTRSGNLIQVKQRNRQTYNIVVEENSMKLLNRRGQVVNEIKKIKDGVYTHQRWRKINSFIQLVYTHQRWRNINSFIQLENGVLIENRLENYRIVLTPEKDEIQIYRCNNLGERLIRKLIKSKGKLYILNHKNRGSEIEITDDRLVTRGAALNNVELEVTYPTID